MDQPYHLARLGVALQRKLGKYESTVHGHFEATPVRRNEGNALYQMLEVFEQLVRQADGPVCVVSDCAINDLYLEHVASNRGIFADQAVTHHV